VKTNPIFQKTEAGRQKTEVYPPLAGQMTEYKQETIDENGQGSMPKSTENP